MLLLEGPLLFRQERGVELPPASTHFPQIRHRWGLLGLFPTLSLLWKACQGGP
jgi:hypothetical protein